MSARQRHHKARIRECEQDLAHNAEVQDAIRLVLRHLHEKDVACHDLAPVLTDLERDREALLAIMAVLAPDEWRWQISERWRADYQAAATTIPLARLVERKP